MAELQVTLNITRAGYFSREVEIPGIVVSDYTWHGHVKQGFSESVPTLILICTPVSETHLLIEAEAEDTEVLIRNKYVYDIAGEPAPGAGDRYFIYGDVSVRQSISWQP